jgi:HlyD family secretion protein
MPREGEGAPVRDGKGEAEVRRLARRVLTIGWKLAVAAAVVAFFVYRARFAPLPVETFPVAMGPIVSEVMGTGTLEARVQATISAKISGRIAQVLADQGDRVAEDQLLATLDDGDLRQQVEMAKADVAATEAGVERATADIASAGAVAVEARVSFARAAQLHKEMVINDQDLDKATRQRDVAEAELRRAELAKVETERQVQKAEETLRYYQARLADTTIRSPFDGLVISRSSEPGDIVVPGSAILQVISTDQMWVSAWVDESAVSSVKVGQRARVLFRSEPDKSYSGTVSRIAPLADRETREFLVDVTVKELPETWAVGQRAEVHLQTASKEQAPLVPQAAIIWRGGKPGVFVNNAGHARWRSLQLGLRGEEVVEVLKGLVPGEVVIWRNDPKDAALTEGRAVSVS